MKTTIQICNKCGKPLESCRRQSFTIESCSCADNDSGTFTTTSLELEQAELLKDGSHFHLFGSDDFLVASTAKFKGKGRLDDSSLKDFLHYREPKRRWRVFYKVLDGQYILYLPR